MNGEWKGLEHHTLFRREAESQFTFDRRWEKPIQPLTVMWGLETKVTGLPKTAPLWDAWFYCQPHTLKPGLKSQWGVIHIRVACEPSCVGLFSLQMLIDVGGASPLWGAWLTGDGPELCKHGKQWVEQVNMYTFRLSVLLIVSVISCSSSCLDFPATRTIIWKCQLNTLYLSKIAIHWVCHHSHRNESRILFQDIAEFCVFI